MLRRIDEEITGHEQLIARSQVELHRLHTTRRTLMNIAEHDVAVAEAAKHERQGVIAGAHAKPVLIVRKAGSAELEERAAKAKANGHDGELNKAGNRRGKTRDYEAERKRRNLRVKAGKNPSVSGELRERILKALDGAEPMVSIEIGDYLGLPRGDVPRKGMSNALYQLRIGGAVIRDDDKRYSLPADRQ